MLLVQIYCTNAIRAVIILIRIFSTEINVCVRNYVLM